jgi:hypothetical protein
LIVLAQRFVYHFAASFFDWLGMSTVIDDSLPSTAPAPKLRGTQFTGQEDLMVAKAFIAASEDPIKGNYQKAHTFRNHMFDLYKALCIEHSRVDHDFLTRTAVPIKLINKKKVSPEAGQVKYVPGMNLYTERNADSVWRRFKDRIAKECMTMVALTYQSPLLSGENEADHKSRLLEEFAKKEGKVFAFQKAYEYLKDRPKWTIYVGENEPDKMPKRGKGQKAAKRLESDKKRVDRIMGDFAADNQPEPVVADALAPTRMMDMFGRVTEDFRQMAYHMSIGLMSPESKAAMKEKAALDLAKARMEKEKMAIDLGNARLDLRKRKLDMDLLEAEAKERQQSAVGRLGLAELTTPTASVASLPNTNAAINHGSDSESTLADDLYERISSRRNKTPEA